ncbi:LysM peptidoglycan-binding domain-containing protein [Cellulomonas sp. P24]|uniref:LysM peptidoglycan-binding domain-containing protein n=1 Tax=Cellulomonas sp. P24 TaxID=2885206 RepID=UPI00216ADDCE|nr:LysM peptidoglycan-binding domain-containing protein [Cellulomonas sp. P24]MCR6491692.1 LysM peptidoglycan-binding domain-containing protein [Cellulomonas sp. P24]
MLRPRGSTAPLALPLGATAAVALTAVLARWSVELLESTAHPTVDELVALASSVIGAGVAAWLSVSLMVATACLVARTAGRSWHRGEQAVQRWAPRVVRRTLVSAVAAGVGLGLGGVAQAATLDPAALDPATVDLGWTVTAASSVASGTPLASLPAGSVSDVSRAVVTTPAHEAPAASDGVPVGSHLVRPGDTLWSIAAEHLAPGADDATIARAWPAWFEANASTIGADPNLLHPGQRLQSPGAGASGADDGPTTGAAS